MNGTDSYGNVAWRLLRTRNAPACGEYHRSGEERTESRLLVGAEYRGWGEYIVAVCRDLRPCGAARRIFLGPAPRHGLGMAPTCSCDRCLDAVRTGANAPTTWHQGGRRGAVSLSHRDNRPSVAGPIHFSRDPASAVHTVSRRPRI